MPKSWKNQGKTMVVAFPNPLEELLGGPLGCLGDFLNRLGLVFNCFGALLDRLLGHGAVWEPSGNDLGPS